MYRCTTRAAASLLLSLSALSAQDFPLARDGALQLRSGERIGGRLEASSSAKHLRLRRGAKLERVLREDVLGFATCEELELQLAELAKRSGDSGFARVQVALRAFELGLFERGLEGIAGLDEATRAKNARAVERLEMRAADEIVARFPERASATVARAFLQKLSARMSGPKSAERRVAWRVLLKLLREEGARQKSAAKVASKIAAAGGKKARARGKRDARTVRAVCRKFATPPMHAIRQAVARRALLALDGDAQRFVYRQALAHPAGSTHERIVGELKSTGHADAAARYLSRWLGQARRGLEMRAVNTLAALGSKEGIAPLEALAKAIPGRMRAFRGGSTGGSRAHVAFTTQQAYIADYEVEVATAAAIAKPVVRNLTSGVVLDATVGAISVIPYLRDLRSATRRSLRALRARK